MKKMYSPLRNGATLFGYALDDADLNRMEFNGEAILFNYGFCGASDTWGIISLVNKETPEDIAADDIITISEGLVEADCLMEPVVKENRLLVFAIAKSIFQIYREKTFYQFSSTVFVNHRDDQHMIFYAKDSKKIIEYFESAGISVDIKRSKPKGFGGERIKMLQEVYKFTSKAAETIYGRGISQHATLYLDWLNEDRVNSDCYEVECLGAEADEPEVLVVDLAEKLGEQGFY